MDLISLLCFAATFFCGGLGAFVLIRNRHSFVHRAFAAGMVALGAEAVLTGLSLRANMPDEVIGWQRMRLIMTACVPGIWSLFSFSFARRNYREFLARVKWLVLSLFALPLALAALFNRTLLSEGPFLTGASSWVIRLGWPGYLLHLILLISIVVILMSLERTYRASTGHLRWQIKFTILGLGGLFAIRIYSVSQALLFWSVRSGLEALNAAVLVIACILMVRSLVRVRMLDLDFYLSQSLIYHSVTVLVVGAYLIVVGVGAKVIHYFDLDHDFPLSVFFIFAAFVILSLFLFSDRARHKVRRFVSLHLKRPHYDYRKEWTAFARKTARLMEVRDLCGSVAKMVGETLEVLAVTIWLVDGSREQLLLGGSTIQTRDSRDRKEDRELIRAMEVQEMPVDMEDPGILWASEFKQSSADYFRELNFRYCTPLISGGELQGIMTLGEKVMKEPFSLEEFDLLKTISDQTAASLLNIRLSDRLRQAKEMEAFQTMSSFMVHDLKNLASTLSLTMQNLPSHFDNPEFREDALRVISQSVAKIKGMCGQLSTLSQKIELKKREMDLNRVVADTLLCINGDSKAAVVQELKMVPRIHIDPEQIQKVLTNLLLNAKEAVGDRGEIRVATEERDRWAVVCVGDNGCGMSREFIERSLFRPFRTTKKQGMGIGLFQCRMIVEAHQGRIEVESEVGKGSTFSVMLPIK